MKHASPYPIKHTSPQPPGKKNRKKIIGIIIGAVILFMAAVCIGISIFVGYSMTHPEKKVIDQSPDDYGMDYEDISFPSREDGIDLSGWVLEPEASPKMTIILAHGYKGNRFEDHVSFFDMAADLLERGYRVVMFDFRYAGDSDGKMVTVGAKEQLDLLGAIDWADNHYEEPIGLLGISMGASTSLLAAAQSDDVMAVVADSPFSDLTDYLKANLPVWSGLPKYPFTPLIMTIMPMITDLNPKEASPISVLDDIAPRPVLFIHNTGDASIPYAESEKMAGKHPKVFQLWLPDGEGHVQAYKQNKQEYVDRVDGFFNGILKEASKREK